MKKLVAVPVFNEELHLLKVLDSIRAHYDGDLLIVNDGSTDRSGELIESVKGTYGLIHLSRAKNAGYGRAIIDSFQFALANGYQRLVTIDCDEQHEPEKIPRFFARLDEGMDVCSCSRYLKASAGDDAPPPDRLEINQTVTSLINRLTGYGLTDSFCGMKAYRVAALKPLDLSENGYAFPLQFWVQAFHFGLVVRECAIGRIYKDQSRSFGAGLNDPAKRLAYYYQVLEKELKRWSIALPSELTLTTSK